jgi:hypothetical protein
VNVQSGHRRGHRVAQEIVNAGVASLVGDVGLTLIGGRVGARPEKACPGPDDGLAELTQLGDGLVGGRARIADQLDLAGVKLGLDTSGAIRVCLGETRPHRGGGVRLTTGQRVNQKQLLLDSN